MSTGEDPERLLAEALRAQAARTALPTPQQSEPVEAPTEQQEVATMGGYGLLSGGQHLGYARPELTARVDPARGRGASTAALSPQRPRSVGWILLFAVLLGLIAGVVVGLVTLL